MPVSRERFDEGLTAEQFVSGLTRNEERWHENLKVAGDQITDADVSFFKEHPVSIVAIGEDWCTDVVQFLPPVVGLAERVPDAVTLRIFKRDENLDLIDQYLKEGKFRSIPVFVLYDQDWNELGSFHERPDEVTREMAAETKRFAEANPQLDGINRTYDNMAEETRRLVHENSGRYRWENMLRWNRIALDQLEAIAAKAPAATHAD